VREGKERRIDPAEVHRRAALGGGRRRTGREAAGHSAEEEEEAGRSPAGEEGDIGRAAVDCIRLAEEGIAGAGADTGRAAEGSRRAAEDVDLEAGGIAVRSLEEAVLRGRIVSRLMRFMSWVRLTAVALTTITLVRHLRVRGRRCGLGVCRRRGARMPQCCREAFYYSKN
jgi:hypothetical protein